MYHAETYGANIFFLLCNTSLQSLAARGKKILFLSTTRNIFFWRQRLFLWGNNLNKMQDKKMAT